MSGERSPGVVLVLYAHDEREFIKAAVASVLAQDYSSLTVVLSDDGSTDGTADVMASMAADYQGPHRVLLNRNATNIGIGSQLNAAVAMADGELVVLANGDDVSERHRVSRTVEAWLDNGRPAALWSDLAQVDAEGRALGRVMDMRAEIRDLSTGMRSRFGGAGPAASLGLRRDVFTRFGPLSDTLMLEDNPLLMRALLLGPVRHIPEPLVRYRVHTGNISQSYAVGEFAEWRERHDRAAVWQAREGVKAQLQMLRDLYEPPAAEWPSADLKRARLVAMEILIQKAILGDYHSGDTAIPWRERWTMLARLAVTLMKVGVKRTLPFIETRNARWHYRRVRGAVGDSAQP